MTPIETLFKELELNDCLFMVDKFHLIDQILLKCLKIERETMQLFWNKAKENNGLFENDFEAIYNQIKKTK